jgi:hypothetical protein
MFVSIFMYEYTYVVRIIHMSKSELIYDVVDRRGRVGVPV